MAVPGGVRFLMSGVSLQGMQEGCLPMQAMEYIAHNRMPPPEERHTALGTGLLQGPRWVRFLMREAPL